MAYIRDQAVVLVAMMPGGTCMVMEHRTANGDRHLICRPAATAPPLGGLWLNSTGLLSGAQRHDRPYVSGAANYTPHIVCAGSGVVQTADGCWRCSTGDMFCLQPGLTVTYHQQPEDPWTFAWVHLVGPEAESYLRLCGFDRTRPWLRPRDPGAVIAGFRRLRESLAEDHGEVTRSGHALTFTISRLTSQDQ